jgi:outer membrane protein TolC
MDFFPDVTFGLETIFTDHTSSPSVSDSGEDPIIAMMSFNLPFPRERRRAAVREARQMRAAFSSDREALILRLSSDLQMALYKYRDAGRKIELYEENLIPEAKQALNVTLQAFQAGTGSSLDLIDAERTLLEFELAYLRALADQAQQFARLELLLGVEIPCKVHGSVMPELELPTNSITP